MGKRSNFERMERDFYPTPLSAITPLVSHLPDGARYCEPCAGAGDLVRGLKFFGFNCVSAFDIEPMGDNIWQHDATQIALADLQGADYIITNPPWDRPLLHRIIEQCALLQPTWLLFDADWVHTRQSVPYMEYCHAVVSVGRVKWIEDSPSVGKDNCAWYLFDNTRPRLSTAFYGRKP